MSRRTVVSACGLLIVMAFSLFAFAREVTEVKMVNREANAHLNTQQRHTTVYEKKH